jgi:hypothetical protein
VLQEMADARLVSTEDAAAAKKQELDLLASTRRSATQSAFLGLVRRQLAADYPRDDLERAGLVVLTTLDPAVQAAAERALTDGIAALGKRPVELDGAVIVTSPHTGEVTALVGGRRTDFEGFNRALDARRPIGSLIKPGRLSRGARVGPLHLATIVEDSPIDVNLRTATVWSPHNFDTRRRPGAVVRALADRSTWRLCGSGLDVGLEPIGECSSNSVSRRKPPLYPSMLLGALALTPLEVAQIYNTLANGGFRVPLRAVRDVLGEDGQVAAALLDRDRAGRRSRRRLCAESRARAGDGARHGPDRARAAAGRSHGRWQDRHVRRPARQLVRGLHERAPGGCLDRRRRRIGRPASRRDRRRENLGARRRRARGRLVQRAGTRLARDGWVDYSPASRAPRAATMRSRCRCPRPTRGRTGCFRAARANRSARGCAICSAPTRHEAAVASVAPRRSTHGARHRDARARARAARDARRVLDARGCPTTQGALEAQRRGILRIDGRAAPGGGGVAPAQPESPPPSVAAPARPPTRRLARLRRCSHRAARARAAGNYAQANATIERALRIAPSDASLWVELGEIELATGNAAQAATLARKALTLASPNDSVAITDAQKLLRAAGGR